jgi:hypothetical protein
VPGAGKRRRRLSQSEIAVTGAIPARCIFPRF